MSALQNIVLLHHPDAVDYIVQVTLIYKWQVMNWKWSKIEIRSDNLIGTWSVCTAMISPSWVDLTSISLGKIKLLSNSLVLLHTEHFTLGRFFLFSFGRFILFFTSFLGQNSKVGMKLLMPPYDVRSSIFN